jgi:hypothetical protein
MAQWPPFADAFPHLAGDWPASLRRALESSNRETAKDIMGNLSVLCSLGKEVPDEVLAVLLWILRSAKCRRTASESGDLHFFSVVEEALTPRQKQRVIRYLRRWNELGIAEMVEKGPLTGLV